VVFSIAVSIIFPPARPLSYCLRLTGERCCCLLVVVRVVHRLRNMPIHLSTPRTHPCELRVLVQAGRRVVGVHVLDWIIHDYVPSSSRWTCVSTCKPPPPRGSVIDMRADA
jgi:hypothetical protein